jgi:hypothetical protein
LAGAQFARAMSYWGELVQIATENQTKAIGQIQEQTRWLSEATASAASGARESGRQGAE